MICPKCGFDQPDDIYCALCGVHIERYARKKKKKRYRAYILIVLIGVSGLAVAKYMHSIRSARHTESRQVLPKDPNSKDYNKAKGQIPVAQKAFPPAPGRGPSFPEDMDAQFNRMPTEGPFPSDRYEDRGFTGTDSIPFQQESEAGLEDEDETLTAVLWFERGKSLDDDSEAEMRCYREAIEIDPKYAPAYYRLGAIYYRQANYELADKTFANFLKYASDAEQETYNIYVYYPLADVERLLESIEEPPSVEEQEKETASEGKKETEETTGETRGLETTEEVMTIVKFSHVNGHIIVPVILNDTLRARVMVDTGAGITVLSEKLAEDLRLLEGPGDVIILKTMAMEIQAQLARLKSIQVGELIRNNFPVAITQMPLRQQAEFDGILGMDFMNSYKIHIDNAKQRIMLTPKM